MARPKDAERRVLILSGAKRLFASEGYDSTSMGSLAKAIGIPVGSVYTYFDSKEALLDSIVEEGWGEFSRYIESGLAEVPRGRGAALGKLAFLVRDALPGLFGDLDLIAILLAQAGHASRLGEKLEFLAALIASIIRDYMAEGGAGHFPDLPQLKAGLAVMLLGSLESMRLIHHAGLDLASEDVVDFLVSTIETALGCALPP